MTARVPYFCESAPTGAGAPHASALPSSAGRERAADEHFGGERPGGHAGGDTTGDDGDRMWPEGRTGVLDDFLRELDEIEADYIRRWSRTVRIPHV